MEVGSKDGTPNASARAFNLLKFALMPEEEEEEDNDLSVISLLTALT